jgi:hypothetical protein
MRSLAASEWLKDPELEVVENKKDNLAGSDFTLYAQQVTAAGDDTANGKKTAQRRTK